MKTVFALDIGTRVVLGLIMEKTASGYEVKASARTEHGQRAMYDGQVHDVEEVAKAVLKVKNELEEKTGTTLKTVAVAAAGRALCTETASVSRAEVMPVSWEKDELLSLEMEAVRKAMDKLNSSEVESGYFYCVGYSVIRQLLEDQPIGNLVGQRGKRVEITVIATFLPRTVIDGLVSVLSRAGLDMESLTLEPIAAGQVAIPADMRRLNLALIDIGAGTADIALTRDGSFFSYGMVPMAGDEVTETICSHYLLDFKEGERIKRSIRETDVIEINNFVGSREIVSREDVLAVIKPTVWQIAEKIYKELLTLNEVTPQAVILVGGGSLTPLLKEGLAETMNLPETRIGIQERERLNNITGDRELTGSDVITPIGIGASALEGQGLHYYSVHVNNVGVPIFEMNLATVAEALLAAGIQPKTFLGRPGAALIYELNGEIKIIKGGLGSPAEILVNGQQAKLEQKVNPGDKIVFNPGKPGEDARAQIKDVVTLPESKRIIYNGQEEIFRAVVFSDGEEISLDDEVKENSRLRIRMNNSLKDFLATKSLNLNALQGMSIIVNNKPRDIGPKLIITVNGQEVQDDCPLKDNDIVNITERVVTVKDLGLEPEPMNFTVNGQDFHLPCQETKVYCKGAELGPDDPVEDGMELRVEGFSRKPILSELFPHLNLPEKAIPRGKLEMLVNGRNADFTTELHRGDRIVIIWTK